MVRKLLLWSKCYRYRTVLTTEEAWHDEYNEMGAYSAANFFNVELLQRCIEGLYDDALTESTRETIAQPHPRMNVQNVSPPTTICSAGCRRLTRVTYAPFYDR